MDSVTIFLPLPHPKLSANCKKSHWAVKAYHTRKAREMACLEARKAMGGKFGPMWEKAALIVRFSFPGACRQDPSNLMRSLKAYEDGLQDAGIIKNDRGLWPERPEITTDPQLRDHPSAAFRRGMVRMVVVRESELKGCIRANGSPL